MWDSAVNAIEEIIDVGEQLWENVMNLDFFDSEGKLRREIDDAQACGKEGTELLEI